MDSIRQEFPVRGRDVLLLFVLIFALLIGVILALPHVFPGGPGSLSLTLAAIGVQVASMVGGVYLVLIRWRGVTWSALGFRAFSKGWVWAAPLLALALAVGAHGVETLLGSDLSENVEVIIAPDGFSWPGLISMILAAGVVAPIVEEILFRGVLYGWLRQRWGVSPSVFLSSALFGLSHANHYLWIGITAVIGVVLALVYERSGSLWPPIFIHQVYNSLAVVGVYASAA